ncbi:patatin-like phospholipase family protein [Aquibacillus kalidii]|uniref:patatin-like phospholipase family protein n=1 Tax=Aquibacillus kalidii TaxID=2762597 RepID=UPI0016465397|nr:patatin-like phospholipase family protein [Aquibacillus kalidii]
MKIDAVFSGGGVKAYAFLGAIKVLEEKGYSFNRVAGTSAGAVMAGFIAAGYRVDEIIDVFEEIDLEKFLDEPWIGKYLPFLKWLKLYFSLGLYKGEFIEQWLYEKFAQKNVYTFSDLPEDRLKVVASDLTMGRIVVFPDDLERFYGINPANFPVSRAIRMSVSIPYFFKPGKIKNYLHGKSILVDGGLLSNFPVWVFDNEKNVKTRPLLGMQLSEKIGRLPASNIKNAIDMVHAIVTTMRKAHDARYISKKDAADIMFLPVKNVDATNFSLDKESKNKLIDLGKKQAIDFLKKWP